MNAEELTEIVTQNTHAIAANTASIAELTKSVLILHDSIKSLETTALAHDAQIDELIESRKILEREWSAYLRRQPNT